MNSPAEIANICLGNGINKVRRPLIKTFTLSIIGGFFLGASSLLSNVCSYNYSGGLAQFYFGLVFPIGIMAIYCAGAELFTGNCLLTIPLLNGNITLIEILLNWLISFVGNFIGAILLSVLVVYGHVPNLFNKTLAQIVIITGTEKTNLGFGEAFVKGILCNFYKTTYPMIKKVYLIHIHSLQIILQEYNTYLQHNALNYMKQKGKQVSINLK